MRRWDWGFEEWERALDEMFERLWGRGSPRWSLGPEEWTPPLDLSETQEAYIIQVELPGIEPEHISLTLERDALIIAGEKPRERSAEGERLHRLERRYGPFRRVIPLPGEVQPEKITATARNGVLTVYLPKRRRGMGEGIPIPIVHEE